MSPPILGESDIAAIMDDLKRSGATVEVTFGSIKTTGLFDHDAVELFGGDMPPVIGADNILHVQATSLPGLASGNALTVDGGSYSVLKVLPYGDGAMIRVALRNA
jgi:hypothetical protein